MGLAALLVLGCGATCLALTIEDTITPAYVREHQDEYSISVSNGADGLIHFKIVHNVKTPMYHVARLRVYHQGKLIAESSTPSFGKKQGNTFHFSIRSENLNDSKFTLSDSAVGGEGERAVPLPGTVIHNFPLDDFVKEATLPATPQK
jgi:hypothetical protein